MHSVLICTLYSYTIHHMHSVLIHYTPYTMQTAPRAVVVAWGVDPFAQKARVEEEVSGLESAVGVVMYCW
jgi:hypothetical protein